MTPAIDLGDQVIITCSSEHGTVVGIARYMSGNTDYLIRYRAMDGRAVEQWWSESAIEPKL